MNETPNKFKCAVYVVCFKEKQENQQVDYVDLRYDTGLAVGYKTVLDNKKQRA